MRGFIKKYNKLAIKKQLLSLIIFLILTANLIFIFGCGSSIPKHQKAASLLNNSTNYYSDLKDLISNVPSDSIIIGTEVKGKLSTNDKIIKLDVLPANSYCDIYKLKLPANSIKISIISHVQGEITTGIAFFYIFQPRLILVDSSFTMISSKLDFTKLHKDFVTGYQLIGQMSIELNKKGQFYLIVCSDNDNLLNKTPYRGDILQVATGSYRIKCSIF